MAMAPYQSSTTCTIEASGIWRWIGAGERNRTSACNEDQCHSATELHPLKTNSSRYRAKPGQVSIRMGVAGPFRLVLMAVLTSALRRQVSEPALARMGGNCLPSNRTTSPGSAAIISSWLLVQSCIVSPPEAVAPFISHNVLYGL